MNSVVQTQPQNHVSLNGSNQGTDTERVLAGPIANPSKKNTDEVPLDSLWNIQTLEDAFVERPPIRYLVKGLIPEASLNIVYSPPGELKSMLLADMAVNVANGTPWLPEKGPESGHRFGTQKASVLWVDVDNGKRRTADRFEALANGNNVPATADLKYISCPDPHPDFNNPGFVKKLGKLVGTNKVEMLFLDNLSQMSGGVDENSAEMSQVMRNLRWLCEKYGCAVIVIHHSRKGSVQGSRKGDSLRGHSSIEGSLDFAFCIERKGDTVTIQSTKDRGCKVEPFYATLEYTHQQGTNELETACFKYSGSKKGDADARIDAAIREHLEENEVCKKTALVNACAAPTGVGKKSVTDRIEYLLAQGVLKEERGKHNAKLISLA